MLSKNQIKFITSLHQKKFRKEYSKFIAEGEKVVESLLHSTFVISEIYCTEDYLTKNHFALSKYSPILITNDELTRISTQSTPQSVLAVVELPVSTSVLSTGLILMLDNIRDPGNLGTIIRIADWFGVQSIICSPGTVEAYNPKVVQATMGSIFNVPLFYTELNAFLENNLKSTQQLPVYATLIDGDSIYETELTTDGLIILGNESEGMREELFSFITKRLSIPSFNSSSNAPDSLNVAISTGIVCSEFKRRLS